MDRTVRGAALSALAVGFTVTIAAVVAGGCAGSREVAVVVEPPVDVARLQAAPAASDAVAPAVGERGGLVVAWEPSADPECAADGSCAVSVWLREPHCVVYARTASRGMNEVAAVLAGLLDWEAIDRVRAVATGRAAATGADPDDDPRSMPGPRPDFVPAPGVPGSPDGPGGLMGSEAPPPDPAAGPRGRRRAAAPRVESASCEQRPAVQRQVLVQVDGRLRMVLTSSLDGELRLPLSLWQQGEEVQLVVEPTGELVPWALPEGVEVPGAEPLYPGAYDDIDGPDAESAPAAPAPAREPAP